MSGPTSSPRVLFSSFDNQLRVQSHRVSLPSRIISPSVFHVQVLVVTKFSAFILDTLRIPSLLASFFLYAISHVCTELVTTIFEVAKLLNLVGRYSMLFISRKIRAEPNNARVGWINAVFIPNFPLRHSLTTGDQDAD
jgi:hypothetical protein